MQYRLDLWATSRHTYVVQALEQETWVIVKRDLPERITRALDALEEITHDILHRAGLRDVHGVHGTLDAVHDERPACE